MRKGDWNKSRAHRVEIAKHYIANDIEPDRDFDSCFEMNDGDEVALKLLQLARRNPGGKLARNLSKYINQAMIEGYEKRRFLPLGV